LRRRLGRQVRSNLDIIVTGRLRAWRWLATAPATYRVGNPRLEGTGPRGVISIPPLDPHGLAPLVSPGSEVVVAAHAAPPSWAKRGTAGTIEPFAMAATQHALDDIGGSPADPVPVLFDRIQQAGRRLTVVPLGRKPQRVGRLDPFDEPAAVVLGGVPLHDVGGGSRGAQLSMELLKRGYHVAYVTRFATWDTADLGLRHIHPRLEQFAYGSFDAEVYAARARSQERVAVCEFPVPEYVAACRVLAHRGFDIVYDLIDDWSDPALGLDWYRPQVERDMMAVATALTASAEALLERLGAGGHSATLVPNGVNEGIFNGEVSAPPIDLPPGQPLLGYHGSLYGDWFDWGAITEVAEAFPTGAVAIIGDARRPPPVPENVHFLGPKAQFQLPRYVGRYDVGLVPFAITATTHAVSPLKAFECLAMGVPVAAPPLRALQGIDGVHLAEPLTDAVRQALAAPPPDGASSRSAHGWRNRLERLLGAIGKDLPAPVDPAPRFELRPAVHYTRRQRRLSRGSLSP
jgi:glycosyltransferase involved in cell wall biosynthesis